MKVYSSIIAVLLLVAMITASVTAKDRPKSKCSNDCPIDYTPVCAGPQGTTDTKKMLSFGSDCVRLRYNCEHGENLVVLRSGECPGGGSVRLQ